MIFFDKARTIGQDANGKNVVWVSIHADSAADLPAYNDYQSDGFILCMASKAHTIADNKIYELNSSGIWVDITPNSGAYTLPPATANSLGGIIVGTGLSIDSAGVLSASSGASMPYTNHNGGIRGNNLGSSFSPEQKAAIAAGTFEDIYVGDYWEISGMKYVIVDIDYYYNFGSPTPTTDHHVVVFPEDVLSTQGYEYDANYYGDSSIYTTYLPAIASDLETIFGQYLINQSMIFYNSGGTFWGQSKCILPSMSQIQGYNQLIEHEKVQRNAPQFSFFRYNKSFAMATQRYWTRDSNGGGSTAQVSPAGAIFLSLNASQFYLRPYFMLAGNTQ